MLVLAAASAASALSFSFPGPATATARHEALASYRLPIGPWTGAAIDNRLAEGRAGADGLAHRCRRN